MSRHSLSRAVRPIFSIHKRHQPIPRSLQARQTHHESLLPWDLPEDDSPKVGQAPSRSPILPEVLGQHKNGELFLRWPGAKAESFLPSFQLRDNCSCNKCRHEETKQRLLDTFSIPVNIKPKSFKSTADALQITWDNDDHESTYSWKWLRAQLMHTAVRPMRAFASRRVKLWDREILSGPCPAYVEFDEIMNSDYGVKLWTNLIRLYGFCFVEGCPPTPEATQKLLERIAFIRPTHYGGFWDFTSDLASKDTAYTSMALEAHTDTTYFSDPAGLQMFHMLSHTDGDGGDSLFVDGWRAAMELKKTSPEAFEGLCNIEFVAHSSGNAGTQIIPTKTFPTLELLGGDNRGADFDTIRIRWNNSDRMGFPLGGNRDPEKWYEAARKFNDIIKDPASEYWVKLNPGRPIIFNNWRVLHGRAAFTGKRRMCGGYINMDDYLSRFRTLNIGKEALFDRI